MNKLLISPSPHVHSGDSIEKNMYGVLIALIPAFICSVLFFGMGAIIVTLTSVVACLFFEYVIQKFLLKQQPTIFDGSALITGVLLAFNVPSNLPVWIIVIGALVAIGIGKMSFGGLGCNIFNPALVGRVFLLISFPVQMTTWPLAQGFAGSYIDAQTGATPLAMLKEAVTSGQSVTDLLSAESFIGYKNMLIGNMGGSLGEVAALALLIGFAYMLFRKIITWQGSSGSPPQVRGKPQCRIERHGFIGITPAGAGKTMCALMSVFSPQDHPRRCGENAVLGVCLSPPVGSPPQVRGKRINIHSSRLKPGITPAGAGKTLKRSFRNQPFCS